MLSNSALEILKFRYLRHGESVNDLFKRVARSIADAELEYGRPSDAELWEERFYGAMVSCEFLPNSPTLMNAGTRLGQLSACFVLPVEDSMEAIFQTLKEMAVIQKTGGGTGFSFSRLRPKGDVVRSTNGKASGPVSFMRVFDCATESIKQGGKRRGANMGVLSVAHPDVEEFIKCKLDGGFRNFNISVAVTDDFFKKLRSNFEIELVNPSTGEVCGRRKSGEIFDLMCRCAWEVGDPGIIYIDEINRKNPTPGIGKIEATNPCGEVPLLPYESCNLGSVNLSKVVDDDGNVNWDKLKDLVWLGVRFLDNVIDVNNFPGERIATVTRANRKIGLGVMGFAESLIKKGIPYDSMEALKFAEQLMSFINKEAFDASVELAKQRGSFPNIDKSVYRGQILRNATRTSIAPTGTISMIAGTSPGIEPLFAIAYVKKHVLDGRELFEINPLFNRYAGSVLSNYQIEEVLKTGSVREVKGVPEEIKRVFATALDVAPVWHLRVQAAFQKYVDNAVSKTVNLRRSATVDDVRDIFLNGYKLKLKGVTVFRYGSRSPVVVPGLERFRLENLYKCDTEVCRVL